MRLIVCDNQQEIANIGADMIAEVITANPTAVLGLATGSTPVPMYAAQNEFDAVVVLYSTANFLTDGNLFKMSRG
jgi:6-phosphogluconolactonase/glucosamine-6-phosphate isomerase/deaminase